MNSSRAIRNNKSVSLPITFVFLIFSKPSGFIMKPTSKIERVLKMYKTLVIGFTKDALQRARLIEEKANEMYAQGWEVVCVTSTPNCGAIITFRQRT